MRSVEGSIRPAKPAYAGRGRCRLPYVNAMNGGSGGKCRPPEKEKMASYSPCTVGQCCDITYAKSEDMDMCCYRAQKCKLSL